ncbi:NAD(P)/FAD-dependent oxidoreductase [Gallaecimonas sp. GXIMD4217]|uniref:FAD-dependent oxidoreductase n=1 Tax=Gallaecimonas sp. GXIMD4217 TaxID=3131927 RepID=UPI00311B2D7F
MTAPRIAIIGGGIAGLAFAVRIRQLGGRVDIYERASLSGREGLGFIMLENGLAAMDKLGLADAVRATGFALDDCLIQASDGQPLRREELTDSYGLARKAFVDVLLNQIPRDWLHFDHRFSHFDFDGQGRALAAHFDNGARVEADWFLGCDGGRSQVRRQIFPDASRSEVRVKELVSIIRDPALVARVGRRFVKTKRLEGGLAVGMVPASQDTLIWFLQFDSHRFDLSDTSFAAKKAFALELVADWPQPIGELIEATNFDQSHLWQTCYLHPLKQFCRRNVVLLGDAAHALLTFTSQGVNSAIEDAALLAQIWTEGFHEEHLDFYCQMRRQAVAPFLKQGIALQDEFLSEHDHDQKIPFAF